MLSEMHASVCMKWILREKWVRDIRSRVTEISLYTVFARLLGKCKPEFTIPVVSVRFAGYVSGLAHPMFVDNWMSKIIILATQLPKWRSKLWSGSIQP